MEVTETINNQEELDNIPFKKGRSQIAYNFFPDTDDAISVKIIESGWGGSSPLFHILIEHGDIMETEYEFGDMQYILAKWPGVKKVWHDFCPDVIVSSQELTQLPNDQELGNWTRKQSIIKHNQTNLYKKTHEKN